MQTKPFDPVPQLCDKMFVWLGGAIRSGLTIEIKCSAPNEVCIAFIREASRWERVAEYNGNWASTLVDALFDVLRMLPIDEQEQRKEAEILPPGQPLMSER